MSTLARSAVVVGAAGLAVGVGVVTVAEAPASRPVASSQVLHKTPGADDSASYAQAESLLADHANNRLDEISRSEVRPALVPDAKVQRATKSAALSVTKQRLGGSMTKSVAPATPREIAMSLLAAYGWDSGQFSCLDSLWNRESGWNPYAKNSSSGAYGIPQALPGYKMATIAGDWATNAETQIKWGLGYIRSSYGSPCGAWGHSESYGWY